MTLTTNPEYEALQALTESEGWKLLCAQIDKEWGSVGFAAAIARTLGSVDMDTMLKVRQLEQATVAQQAVMKVQAWPTERMRQLKRQESQMATPSMSRRGPGL